MTLKIHISFALQLAILLIASCSVNNTNDLVAEERNDNESPITWDNYPNGTYSEENARIDLGNVNFWNDSRANIEDGSLKITLAPNSLSNAGGLISKWEIENATSYEISYDIKFDMNFVWSKGGKCGFGLQLGDGNTGGDPAWDGNGGSMRMMWYTNSKGRTYLQPYVYYKDQPTEFGDNFGKSYPISGNLNKNIWYKVKIIVSSNSDDLANGHVFISVNNITLLDQKIKWTTNNLKNKINKVTFTTFRGGSSAEWESSQESHIYYDNLNYHILD